MSECQEDPQIAEEWGKWKALYIIPARWKSSRFPGKPLADIGGKPMIWHVYQRCLEANPQGIILVATDDDRIEAACATESLGCMRTADTHLDCLDRAAEVASRMAATRYIIVQGDEPFVSPEAIRRVTAAAYAEILPVCGVAPITDPADLVDVNVIKVVICQDSTALYLSRCPVPYPKSRSVTYLKQICIYGFRSEDLTWFASQKQGPAEIAEGIGLLRYLEQGHAVRMVEVEPSPLSVDSPEDLTRAVALLNRMRSNE